jgi:GNAT superfamily N-acetyltransferase
LHRNSSDNSGIIIRQMYSGDIADGMRLKTIAGWNQTENDWKLYLEINPAGCFAAVDGDRVVGTVTTFSYENKISWIGMMLVDPDYRRIGIARKLMCRAIDHLEGSGSIKLDATPAGRRVYEKLGFKDEFNLIRLTCGSARVTSSSIPGISGVTDNDLPEISGIDEPIFGAVRMPLLAALVRLNPGFAVKLIRDDTIRGYSFCRPGTQFYQVGPVVAHTAKDAMDITTATLSNLTRRAVVIDVPSEQRDFLRWLISAGFSEERSFMRMYYGNNDNPGKPSNVYAITGPEFG